MDGYEKGQAEGVPALGATAAALNEKDPDAEDVLVSVKGSRGSASSGAVASRL